MTYLTKDVVNKGFKLHDEMVMVYKEVEIKHSHKFFGMSEKLSTLSVYFYLLNAFYNNRDL